MMNDKLNEQLANAIKENNIEKVSEILEKGADANFKDKKDVPMLLWACLKADIKMLKLLVEKGADCTAKGIIQITDTSHYGNLTGIAAAEGKLDILQYLIETMNIDVDDKEPKHGETPRWTALQWALSKGHTKIVQYLLSKNANPNPIYHHTTALHVCIQKQAINSFKALLKAGATIDVPGYRPLLSEACRYPNHRFLEILVEKGAAVNAEKQAPIFFAVAYGELERVKWLIAQGAKANVTDAYGHSPMSLAKKLQLKKIEKLLKKQG